jgi:DNA-binding NarL/FixJ family response regulator
MSQVHILISDGHEEVRRGAEVLVNANPDLNVCALATNCTELVELAKNITQRSSSATFTCRISIQ